MVMQNEKSLSRMRGFTLIELLIVIAIIGVLASIVIPTYQGSVRKANEGAAVATLHTIKIAQAKYVGDHNGQYGTFKQLFEEGYLDKRFNSDSPHLRGYVFTLNLISRPDKTAPMFTLNANPECFEGFAATGKNFYYTDTDGGICFSKGRPATAEDDML
jgi:prepilin-type N-terminal cleavage/methylation domain-containing protein